MKKSTILIITILTIIALLLMVAVTTGHMPGMMNHSMGRHMRGLMGNIPEPYTDMKNPLPATMEVVAKGAELYTANCAVCHGESGRGDGPGGINLSPRPSDLVHILNERLAQDSYLFWAISEGGRGLSTAMPTFKGRLDEQARWQIIRYLRTLTP